MNTNKTTKKTTALAATLCMATAFCGICAGVATTVKAESAPATRVETRAAAASTGHKVVLCPGWNFDGNKKVKNTITDAGVTEADGATVYAENAYIAEYTANENLPKPTAGKAGLTFVGWRYAKDGELVTIEKMPASLTEDLYLYAEWQVGSGSGSGGGQQGGGQGGGESGSIVLSGASCSITFGGGEVVVITLTNIPDWADEGSANVHMWTSAGDADGGYGNWKLNGTGHYTTSAALSDVTFKIGFTEKGSGKETQEIKGSTLQNGKEFKYTGNYDSPWVDGAFTYTVTSSNIIRN